MFDPGDQIYLCGGYLNSPCLGCAAPCWAHWFHCIKHLASGAFNQVRLVQRGAGASNIAPADGASKYLTLEANCIVNINDDIYYDSFNFCLLHSFRT